MERKHTDIRRGLVVLMLVIFTVLGLVACGSGQEDATPEVSAPVVNNDGDAAEEPEGGAEGNVEEGGADAPEATPTLREQIPDSLVVHPDAFDFEITPASNTYIYIVPGMVAETLEYMEAEFTSRGWEALGKPTVMGHLATLNLQMGKSRLTVSMQDNERTETTRVQMVYFES